MNICFATSHWHIWTTTDNPESHVCAQFRKQLKTLPFINYFLVLLFLSKLSSCFQFALFFKDFVLIVLNTQVKTFLTYCYIMNVLQSVLKLLFPFKYPFPFTIQYISLWSYIINGIHFLWYASNPHTHFIFQTKILFFFIEIVLVLSALPVLGYSQNHMDISNNWFDSISMFFAQCSREDLHCQFT